MLATGTILDVIQVFAWSRMWVDNVQTQSVGDAFSRTFSEEGMCPLCESVQAIKRDQAERYPFAIKLFERCPLLLPQGIQLALIVSADPDFWPEAADSNGFAFRNCPPVPPPRVQMS